ncbi:hypothetical protein DICPUDRAFT_151641 [Dictyostelium purpureum]|uniref:Uncharacterized protein n=1 Tax=Dictyostelium purpureum TaxID=5786 RepID=F0ZJD4_DICPU|nr:uncharacterized protein DICPUDRAFT_151641 [Dictyostelium purpureum]EGC35960.1 hypothetical protein DICPUDRAFT_151641 [Dictyostelium purpureum]|eukprot:XP_003287533.1 hypothetical protein DICPUDRAFT_151641 [Dictyostelium purpureum]
MSETINNKNENQKQIIVEEKFTIDQKEFVSIMVGVLVGVLVGFLTPKVINCFSGLFKKSEVVAEIITN